MDFKKGKYKKIINIWEIQLTRFKYYITYTCVTILYSLQLKSSYVPAKINENSHDRSASKGDCH